MEINFTKWQGCGNDFLLLDCLEEAEAPVRPEGYAAFAQRVCDRHYGVGGDGVLVVERPTTSEADFRMRIFNTDGSEAEMCGNGIRCFARYLYDFGRTGKQEFTVETGAGILVPRIILEDGKVTGVRVDMGEPRLKATEIPVTGCSSERVIEQPLEVAGQSYDMTCVSMGNPHAVQVVENVDTAPVLRQGPLIENHPAFPNRVNAGFMEIIDRHHIKLRVFERGAGETLHQKIQ